MTAPDVPGGGRRYLWMEVSKARAELEGEGISVTVRETRGPRRPAEGGPCRVLSFRCEGALAVTLWVSRTLPPVGGSA